jgi:type VI secretion system protein ImpK
MPEKDKWALQTLSILTEYFRQIRFARAAELARSRRYLEATVVLSPNGGLPTEPTELDLLARIAAQQKRFDQAARLWEAALQRSPDNETYKRAIQRTIAAKQNRRRIQLIAANLISAILAAMLVLAVLHFGPWRARAPKNQLKGPEPTPIVSPEPQPESKGSWDR